MTREGFAAAFPSESHFVEWKTGLSRSEIQKTVVAFSNADGGVLMIGVTDEGRLRGKPLDDGLEKTVWEIIQEIESPGSVELNGLRVGEVDITVISVAERLDAVAQTSDGTLLIRRGKQNLPLKGGAFVGLVSHRERQTFDSSPSRWALPDADSDLLARLCRAFEIDPTLSETDIAADLRSEPTFAEEIDGHVTVRLPVESPVSPEERAWVREQEGHALLRPEDRRVLIEAARGVELTNTAVRALLDIDSTRARRSLQRLRDAGFLQQVGEGRGTCYRIVPSMQRSVGIRLDRTELRSIVLAMAADGAVTNTMVRSRLGLSRNEVVRLLSGLTADGYLELRGSKRGAHYVLAAL